MVDNSAAYSPPNWYIPSRYIYSFQLFPISGILLFVTPGYVFFGSSYSGLSGIGGELFCRMVFSTYLLFVCGKAANASIMCLAVERWYAVVRPTKYKCRFGRRRLYIYIALIWASAAFTEVFELFIAKLVDGSCKWITPFYGQQVENLFVALHVTITFYIPSVVTWVSFIHIWFKFLANPSPGNSRENPNIKKSVLRMCVLAALFLTICWFPTETFFILRKFNVFVLSHKIHLGFNVLAFFSACVNPFIYCLSNKSYRREFKIFFQQICCLSRFTRVVPKIVLPAPASLQNHEDNQLQLQQLHVHAPCNSPATSVIHVHVQDFIDMHPDDGIVNSNGIHPLNCMELTSLPRSTP